MADTENTPQFFMFTTRKKGEREKRFENLKKRFTMAQILKYLNGSEDIEEGTEEEIAARIERSIMLENAALVAAVNAEDAEKKNAYKEKLAEEGYGERKGIFEDYFEALEEWKKQENDYEEFVQEKERLNREDPNNTQARLTNMDNHKESIDANNKYYNELKDYLGWRDELSELSPSGQTTRFIDTGLIKTYKDIKDMHDGEDKKKLSGQFNQIFEEYLNDEKFRPAADSSTGKEINKHSFSLAEDKNKGQKYIRHTITNLDNTGLNLAMLADGIDITHHADPMTEGQLKALAQYCYHHNLDIKDFLKLQDVKVKDETDNIIGTVPEQFDEKTKELEANGGEYKKENNIKINEEEHARVKSDVLKDNEIISFGAYDPNEPSPKDVVGVRSKMVDKAMARIGIIGYPNPALMNVSHGMNSTIISVYNNENDKLVDGQTDKDGKRQHTKAFAVELLPTTPPSAKFYIPATKDFNDKHARVILESFKACGSEYFTIPNANEIGGQAFGHFMTAAGKALMVPMCKRGKNQPGVDLDNDHIASILEVIKKENKFDADKVIQFKQKLLRELKAQENGRVQDNNAEREKAIKEGKTIPKEYKTNSTLATTMATIEGDIKFGKFRSSYLGQLQKFVNEGIANGYGNPPQKWDGVDRAAACLAMLDIAKQLAKGSLDGKKFDPLDKDGKNMGLLQKELAKRMAVHKPNIVEDIKERFVTVNKEDTKESKWQQSARAIFSEAENKMREYYTNDLNDEFGIEKMVPSFNKIDLYDMDKYRNGIPPTQFGNEALDNAHNNSTKEERSFDITQDSREKQEQREFFKAREEAREKGRTLSLEEWRTQKAREQAARAAQANRSY